jgi:heat-inducible transcriptional repressor
MSYNRLENKEKIVLNLSVELYLQTGKAVSSACLAQRMNNVISPATIRNIMAELEKEEYLYQPHTSAGRFPPIRVSDSMSIIS